MKKIILFVIMICALNIAFCQRANPLINDNSLIETIKKMNSLNKLIYESNNGDIAKIKGFENQIKTISSNLSDAECNRELVRIFNLPKNYDLVSDLRFINLKQIELKNRLGTDYNSANLEGAITEYNKLAPYGPHYDLGGDSGGPCKNQTAYAACTVVVGTASAIAYGGCVGTILGAPLCFAVVAAGQTAAIYICWNDHCK
jgi:hypothetical protein